MYPSLQILLRQVLNLPDGPCVSLILDDRTLAPQVDMPIPMASHQSRFYSGSSSMSRGRRRCGARVAATLMEPRPVKKTAIPPPAAPLLGAAAPLKQLKHQPATAQPRPALKGKEVEDYAMYKQLALHQSHPGGLQLTHSPRWSAKDLELAYERCGEVTSEYAKTFYLGTTLMTPQQAKATWAIYVWCRRTDELVDGPNASKITPKVGARCWR
jgi:hypothetical protein